MNKFLGSLAAFIITANANGQVPGHTPRMIAAQNMPPVETAGTEDVQRNFLDQNWRTGTVSFRGTAHTMQVPLIFDVYSNKLYFFKDSIIMDFMQPIKEFTIGVAVKQQLTDVLYRSGYPAIHKNTDETFYEVLVDGKFQLLRCKAKTIGLYKDRDVPENERDYSKELFYAFVPGGKMILVKTEKDHLLKEMPEQADAIERICAEKKLKLKNESQLKELFTALNK